MEIIKPSINPAIIMTHNLLVLARLEPMSLPTGVMPISTPSKKIVRPIIINIDPIRKGISKDLSRGKMVKFNNNTSIVIGKTEDNTSLSLLVRLSIQPSPFCGIASLYYLF